MKPILIVVLLILSSINCHSQELKKVKKRNFSKIPYNQKGKLKTIDEFQVLKSDKETKQGSFTKYIHKNQIFEKGSYENNQKVGIWEYYNFDGELSMKFNHSINKVDSINDDIYTNFEFDEVKYLNAEQDSYPKNTVMFIGGKDRFLYYFMYNSNFDFPHNSILNGVSGKVKTSFFINTTGEITEVKIEDSLNNEIDEMIINSIQNIPNEFIPYPENELLKQDIKCYLSLKLN